MFRHHDSLLTRATLVAASFTTTALLMAALGGAFHGASREPWLRDSPAVRAMLARCEARAGPVARQACVREGITLVRTGLPADARLASASAGAADEAVR